MGIGIYGAYHLCDKLTITSKKEGNTPNKLTMNFAEMKSILSEQRVLRLNGEFADDIDGMSHSDLNFMQTFVQSRNVFSYWND